MLRNITLFTQSSIRIENDGKIMYVDPFGIEKNFHDADFIFITHDHYDHFSPDDIAKVRKSSTFFILPRLLKSRAGGQKVLFVEPQKTYNVENLVFETVAAYNTDGRTYHPKSSGWIGYVLTLGTARYYISGDTDITPEALQVKCDVAFVPAGGTFTMDAQKAAELVNAIHPALAVPTHYGSIIGDRDCGKKFKRMVDPEIKVELLL
jgi:L-ascorbate metabolism protein UlaG (beta-lactamase superfamily)